MTVQILISALIAAGIVFLLWALRGAVLLPLRPGKNTELKVMLRIKGPEPRLEQTLDGILWLRKNGTLPASIVIEDAGMDEETRNVAKLAADSRNFIDINSLEEIGTE